MNRNNRIGVDDSELLNSNSTQVRTSSEQLRKRKLLWITISILVLDLIIIISIFIFYGKKPNVENPSIVDITTEESAITITTTTTTTSEPLETKILTTETIKITTSTEQLRPSSVVDVDINTKWKQIATTVAGGNGREDYLNQLHFPSSIYIDDDDECIYISDTFNNRIVKWKFGAKTGEIVAGGNGKGDEMNQLDEPRDAILDKKNDSLIICDSGNYRVIKWYRGYDTNQQIMIRYIVCYGLTMDNNGDLYVSIDNSDEVRRWKQGDTVGISVAGNNGYGNHLNQFDHPRYIFVDQNYSLYVADLQNGRAMKWMKDAKEGIVVARGHASKENPDYPASVEGVIVDYKGNIYVSDPSVCKITRWPPGAREGTTVVGQSGCGKGNNQLLYPLDLSFDRQGNLYVVDHPNHRIQKFSIDLD